MSDKIFVLMQVIYYKIILEQSYIIIYNHTVVTPNQSLLAYEKFTNIETIIIQRKQSFIII